jgi:hypothetical protein
MDGLLSVAPNCEAVAILPSSIFPNVQLHLKRLAGSPKGWNWSQPAPLTKCYSKVAHAFLYTWWTSFANCCPSRCYLTFFHIPERSIALVKRLAGSPKGWNWSQPAYANKVLLKVAHAFLYTWILSSHKLCPPLLSYLLPYSRTFNCTSKTTGWFTKGWNWSTCPTLTKVLLQGSTHSYIHGWTSFSRIVPKPLLSYLLPTFNCTSKTAGSPKELKWSQPTLTKCYSR